MTKKTLTYLSITGLIFGGLFLMSLMVNTESESGSQTALDRLQDDELFEQEAADVFQGQITDKEVSPGTIRGIGVYDRSCVPVDDGLTQCDAGILTEEYDVLNFEYTHDMATEPCLVPNEILTVEITNEDGLATVNRHSRSLH